MRILIPPGSGGIVWLYLGSSMPDGAGGSGFSKKRFEPFLEKRQGSSSRNIFVVKQSAAVTIREKPCFIRNSGDWLFVIALEHGQAHKIKRNVEQLRQQQGRHDGTMRGSNKDVRFIGSPYHIRELLQERWIRASPCIFIANTRIDETEKLPRNAMPELIKRFFNAGCHHDNITGEMYRPPIQAVSFFNFRDFMIDAIFPGFLQFVVNGGMERQVMLDTDFVIEHDIDDARRHAVQLDRGVDLFHAGRCFTGLRIALPQESQRLDDALQKPAIRKLHFHRKRRFFPVGMQKVRQYHIEVYCMRENARVQASENNPENVAVAVLAGGSSSRCETGDKRELVIDGSALGRRAVLNALSLSDRVFVIGSLHPSYQDLPISCFQDEIPGFGPLSGLHAALDRAETGWCYLLACDMPLVSPAWYALLLEKARTAPEWGAFIARTSNGYLEPFHGLYSSRLKKPLEVFLQKHQTGGRRQSISSFLATVDFCAVEAEEVLACISDWQLFSSINCQREYFDFIKNYRY